VNSSTCNFAIRARWVFPVAAPPISGGVVTIRDGRIAAVGENLSGAGPIDLEDAAIVPGLVNAHTHLEFSELEEPLGEPGAPFPEWIGEVIAWRRRRDATEDEGVRRRERAVEVGLTESAAAGVAALGEIASPGWSEAPFQTTSIDCTVFQELLGLAPERRASLSELAAAHLDAGGRPGVWRPALSPHAPYTTTLELVDDAVDLSCRRSAPLAMHLAESLEELELLRTGTGPFRELLAGLVPRLSDYLPRNVRPLDFLKRLSRAPRTLVIHGNYLADDELACLAEHAETMSVVYCPRTHHYFRHEDYPLEKMLALGIRVALGTDSRASNPDLGLWEEMRYVARRYTRVSPATVLSLATQAGAAALGLSDACGVLAPGRRADFVVVAVPQRAAKDPHESLYDDDAHVAAVYAGGSRIR
jgi:cytosine/adenosine deaminase-related metal-dependent hydrolase